VVTKSREQLCVELADLTADYRAGELCRATPEHVQFWLDQFEETDATKTAFLAELLHVLKQTYFSKEKAMNFLGGLVINTDFTGADPKTFWENAAVLDIQRGGRSQTEFRALLQAILQKEFGVTLADPALASGPHIYLDDAIFSGTRVISDLQNWLPSSPTPISLRIVVCAMHTAASYRCGITLKQDFEKLNKQVDLKLWRAIEFENKKNSGAFCDVLRLKAYPDDDRSTGYMASFGDGKPPALLRPASVVNRSKYFTSEENRDLLERVFWKAGLQIRAMCPNLKVMHRPMGYTSTNSENRLGFGSLFISFRNCPNNAPLALWADDPWYPLFTRDTN